MAARSFQEAFETPALCRADVKSPLAKSLPGVHLDAAPSLRPAAGHGPAGSLAGSEGLPARCSQETSAPGRGLYTRGPGEAAASRRTDWRRGPPRGQVRALTGYSAPKHCILSSAAGGDSQPTQRPRRTAWGPAARQGAGAQHRPAAAPERPQPRPPLPPEGPGPGEHVTRPGRPAFGERPA